jgi:hypothetical protein
VHLFSLLPPTANRAFADLLDTATPPFDTANYLGSRCGARVISHERMAGLCDKTLAVLLRHLDREPEEHLADSMAFPTRWDPFFKSHMTLADVYRYPTEHFRFHEAQLTLAP